MSKSSNRHNLRVFAIHSVVQVFKHLSSLGRVAFPCLFAYLSIRQLAGEETVATMQVVIDVLKNRSTTGVIVGMIGSAGVSYGIIERAIRKRKVGRLVRRIEVLQNALDPGRKSSNLDAEGNEQSEDK